MREPTIVATFPKALVDFSVSRGADRQALLDRAGVCSCDLEDPDGRVPVRRHLALLRAGIELCNEPALALLFGENVPMDDLSIVALIVRNAGTADAAEERINRYAPLLLDDGQDNGIDPLALVRRPGKVWITFASTVYSDNPLITESAIARGICGARTMIASAGGAEVARGFPDAIHFTYSEPPHVAAYKRLCGVPLVFDSDVNAVVVDETFFSIPLPRVHGAAVGVATEHAERLLARLANAGSTRKCVEDALMSGLAGADLGMNTIARRMGLSRATLSRRLRLEGVTFGEVLDEVRRKQAFHYLKDERLPVRRAAHLLGFSDAAAFSRAFKRWTGMSPRDVASGSTRR